jgi:hypothetical protein
MTLHCFYDTNVTPLQIMWLQNNISISPGEGNGSTSIPLQIKRITRSNSRSYIWTVWNDVGVGSDEVCVVVMCKLWVFIDEKLYLSGGTIGVKKKNLVTPLLVHFPQRCVGWSHCKNTKYKIRTACKFVFHVCVMTSYIYGKVSWGWSFIAHYYAIYLPLFCTIKTPICRTILVPAFSFLYCKDC